MVYGMYADCSALGEEAASCDELGYLEGKGSLDEGRSARRMRARSELGVKAAVRQRPR
jgi:hypothetical protein